MRRAPVALRVCVCVHGCVCVPVCPRCSVKRPISALPCPRTHACMRTCYGSRCHAGAEAEPAPECNQHRQPAMVAPAPGLVASRVDLVAFEALLATVSRAVAETPPPSCRFFALSLQVRQQCLITLPPIACRRRQRADTPAAGQPEQPRVPVLARASRGRSLLTLALSRMHVAKGVRAPRSSGAFRLSCRTHDSHLHARRCGCEVFCLLLKTL